jgi:hypothetical protein
MLVTRDDDAEQEAASLLQNDLRETRRRQMMLLQYRKPEDGEFYYSDWNDDDELVLRENRTDTLETITTNTAFNEQAVLDVGIPGPKELLGECITMAQNFTIPSNGRTCVKIPGMSKGKVYTMEDGIYAINNGRPPPLILTTSHRHKALRHFLHAEGFSESSRQQPQE